MADTKPKALMTPEFRVSFPSVFTKSQYGESEPKYSVVALFTPASFSDKDKEKWRAIRAALDTVCLAEFKKNLNDMVKANPSFKVCGMPTTLTPKGAAIWYRRGETKPHLEGYGAGVAFFTLASTKRRPGVIDTQNVPLTEEEFYAGCYARATVLPFTYDNKFGKGVSLGLGNLQKLKDGESFSGFSSAEEDFGGEAAEFDEGVDESVDELDPAA